MDKIIPDKSTSIYDGGISPLGKHKNTTIFWQIEAILEKYDCNIKTPMKEIPDDAIDEIMKYLDGCVLLIIGKGDVFPVLYQLIEDNLLNSKIMIKNKMTFEELRQYTINADLGLAIDKDTNLNYRFSLPNKIFDYIHSGIPTLATELPELKRIISGYDVGYFIPDHNPQHIAEKMEAIFSDKNGYEKKKNNTRTAKAELCWENEEMKLIALIQKEANNSKT